MCSLFIIENAIEKKNAKKTKLTKKKKYLALILLQYKVYFGKMRKEPYFVIKVGRMEIP